MVLGLGQALRPALAHGRGGMLEGEAAQALAAIGEFGLEAAEQQLEREPEALSGRQSASVEPEVTTPASGLVPAEQQRAARPERSQIL